MFVELQEEYDQPTLALRKKQAMCHHPSYVCTLCHLHKDNLHNHYKLIIYYLLKRLENYEHKLDEIDPVFCHICESCVYDIIKSNPDNPEIDKDVMKELLNG